MGNIGAMPSLVALRQSKMEKSPGHGIQDKEYEQGDKEHVAASCGQRRQGCS